MAENKKFESKENKEERKKTTISITEPLPFDPNIESCYINTLELANVVDELFAQSFRDYAGCNIRINDGSSPYVINEVPNGALYVELYFKTNAGSGNIPNVENRADKPGKTKLDILMNMGNNKFGRKYDVTPETYEALEDFMFYRGGRRPNWNKLTFEISSTIGYPGAYNNEIVACVSGLSLESVLNAIYGTEENGKHFQYQAVPVQIVLNHGSNHYVIQITKLDMSKLEDIRRSLGGYTQTYDFHHYVK